MGRRRAKVRGQGPRARRPLPALETQWVLRCPGTGEHALHVPGVGWRGKQLQRHACCRGRWRVGVLGLLAQSHRELVLMATAHSSWGGEVPTGEFLL